MKAAVDQAQRAADLEFFEKEQKLKAELKRLQLQKAQKVADSKVKVAFELESNSSHSSDSIVYDHKDDTSRSRNNIDREPEVNEQ